MNAPKPLPEANLFNVAGHGDHIYIGRQAQKLTRPQALNLAAHLVASCVGERGAFDELLSKLAKN